MTMRQMTTKVEPGRWQEPATRGEPHRKVHSDSALVDGPEEVPPYRGCAVGWR